MKGKIFRGHQQRLILVEVSDIGDSVFNDPNYSAYDIEQCEDTTFE